MIAKFAAAAYYAWEAGGVAVNLHHGVNDFIVKTGIRFPQGGFQMIKKAINGTLIRAGTELGHRAQLVAIDRWEKGKFQPAGGNNRQRHKKCAKGTGNHCITSLNGPAHHRSECVFPEVVEALVKSLAQALLLNR